MGRAARQRQEVAPQPDDSLPDVTAWVIRISLPDDMVSEVYSAVWTSRLRALADHTSEDYDPAEAATLLRRRGKVLAAASKLAAVSASDYDHAGVWFHPLSVKQAADLRASWAAETAQEQEARS